MTQRSRKRTLGAILYEGFELLDLYGPLEMLGARVLSDKVKIITVAEKTGAVRSDQGPSTVVDHSFETCPECDLLLIPGGFGTIPQLKNRELITFLKKRVSRAELTLTVCTGSWLLAAAGLLEGRRATSNKAFFAMGAEIGEGVEWIEQARWVEDDAIFTSSGVSAGIDMTLAAIARLYGKNMAQEIANMAEYVWHQDPDRDPFCRFLNSSLTS